MNIKTLRQNRSVILVFSLLMAVLIMAMVSQRAQMESFSMIFISILLEATPFVLIGTLVSSLIQIYVNSEIIEHFLPKNRVLGVIVAALLGILFPLCECTIVPIMRRLVKKGVPLSMAVSFMLATPIVNPVVLLSTWYAFSGWHFVFYRGFLGALAAILIGLLIGRLYPHNPLLEEEKKPRRRILRAGEAQRMQRRGGVKKKWSEHLWSVLEHGSHEFFEVGRFLIFGALLSAFMQVFVSKSWINEFSGHPVIGIAMMMLLAFLLSLCSEADAFIGRTFLGNFSTPAVVAFLIFGPMLDVKNVTMLLGGFKIRFVLRLAIVITSVCFLLSLGLWWRLV